MSTHIGCGGDKRGRGLPANHLDFQAPSDPVLPCKVFASATDDHDDHASYSQLRRKDVLPSDPVLPCKVFAAATDDHDHATRWW